MAIKIDMDRFRAVFKVVDEPLDATARELAEAFDIRADLMTIDGAARTMPDGWSVWCDADRWYARRTFGGRVHTFAAKRLLSGSEALCRYRLAAAAILYEDKVSRPPSLEECANWLRAIAANDEGDDLKMASEILRRIDDIMKADADAVFWKRMFTRLHCGCMAADCITHGAYDGADLDRLDRENVPWRKQSKQTECTVCFGTGKIQVSPGVMEPCALCAVLSSPRRFRPRKIVDRARNTNAVCEECNGTGEVRLGTTAKGAAIMKPCFACKTMRGEQL